MELRDQLKAATAITNDQRNDLARARLKVHRQRRELRRLWKDIRGYWREALLAKHALKKQAYEVLAKEPGGCIYCSKFFERKVKWPKPL